MSLFSIAYDRLQPLEGGYVYHKDDRGGATNYGLSSRFLNACKLDGTFVGSLDDNKDGYIDSVEIKDIKKEESAAIYKIYFWLTHRYKELEDQALANNIFDFGVHAGNYKANLLLQRAINEALADKILEDGLIGNQTIKAANSQKGLLERYKTHRRKFYHAIVAKNPSQEKFLRGWLKRVDA